MTDKYHNLEEEEDKGEFVLLEEVSSVREDPDEEQKGADGTTDEKGNQINKAKKEEEEEEEEQLLFEEIRDEEEEEEERFEETSEKEEDEEGGEDEDEDELEKKDKENKVGLNIEENPLFSKGITKEIAKESKILSVKSFEIAQGPQTTHPAKKESKNKEKSKEKEPNKQDPGEKLKEIFTAQSSLETKPKKEEQEEELNENIIQKPDSRGQEKRDHAIFLRKRMRFLAYFAYLLVIATVVGIGFKYLVLRDSLLSHASADLKFTIDNCTLLITDKPKTSSIRRPVYLKYQVPTELDFEPLTTVVANMTSKPQTLEVLNGIDSAFCLIELLIEPKTPLGSLEINCTRCNVTQDTSFQLEVENSLIVSGEVINANFKDIKVGSFSYEAITGYIQLNHIQSAAETNPITMSKEGDIIIQSTEDFQLDATSDTHAFCFGAPYIRQVSASNCSISGQNDTKEYRSNTDCNLVYDICSKQGCSKPSTKYVITSTTGNIYANIISGVGIPISKNTSTIVKGQIYDDGISFSPDANETINGFKDLLEDKSIGNPFILFNLGNIQSRSSKYTKWVISSTPSYSLLRPWWIGTFSASVLNGYVKDANGFLLPGFCPFVPQFTTQDLLTIQELITTRIDTLVSLVTFVSDESMDPPPIDPQPDSGIFPLIPKGNPNDKWFSLTLAPNGEILVEDNDYTQKGEILAAVVVSMVIAAYVTFTALQITFIGVNRMYFKLVDFANHLTTYSNRQKSSSEKELEQESEDKKDQNQPKLAEYMTSKYGLINIMKYSPSPLAFIDYLSLILYRQFSSSVMQFYHLLFKEENEKKKSNDDQELNPQSDMMTGTEIKVLYEKFCFMNHLVEEKLTDPANVQILKKYGFEIMTREDLQIEVFTKINIKNYDAFVVNPDKNTKNLNSLEFYIQENAEITQFDEDNVEVSTFIRIYNEFCDFNRLPRVPIAPSMMKEMYGVNVSTVPQKFIIRSSLNSDDNNVGETGDSSKWWQKFLPASWRNSPKKIYSLNTSKLQNHFNFVMKKIEGMKESDVQEATADLILYPRWEIWDAVTVFFHLLIGASLTVPLIGLIVLNESQYKPWSLKNPLELASFEDFYRNPSQLVANIYNSFSWNIVLMFLVTVLWIISFFDIILYYAIMEFPQDQSFKKSQKDAKQLFPRISRQIEWLLFFISLALYFGYIGLVITWLLLGAFINPNAFLPFASAAVTFVTFLVTKYKSFQELSRKGTKAVLEYVNERFGSFINKVTKKISQSIDKATNNFTNEKMKELTESDAFKSVTDTLVDTGIVDPATVAEYTKKLEGFNTETLVSGAVTIAEDPSLIMKEVESIGNSLKTRTLAKIKEKCVNQDIKPDLIDLIISIISKDQIKSKHLLTKILQECYDKKAGGKDENIEIIDKKARGKDESIEIIIEILFPEKTNKDATIQMLIEKILKLAIAKNKLGEVKELNTEQLKSILDSSRSLQDQNMDKFVKHFEEMIKEKKGKFSALEYYMPVLQISAILSKDHPDYWNSKIPCLQLIKAASFLSEKKNDKDLEKDLEKFIQFLPFIFSNNELVYDKKDELIEADDVTQIILEFCEAIGLAKNDGDIDIERDNNLRANFIYFATALIKQQTLTLPKKVIKGIEAMFEVDIPKTSSFLEFCLNLANVIYHKPKFFYQRIDRCISTYEFPTGLQNFLKLISCYVQEDFELVYPKITFDKNPYFLKIAEKMKANPSELQGLIDLITNKKDSIHINVMLNAILTRMNLNSAYIEEMRSLVDIFLSNDESRLLHALKVLNLDQGHFLLVGKAIMNPLYISDFQFKAVGITESNLINQKTFIYNSSFESYVFWKNEIRKNIAENIKQAKDMLDSNKDEKKIPQNFNKEEVLKFKARAELVYFYLSDWDSFTYSIKNLREAINALDNSENKLKKNMLYQKEGSANNGIDFLAKILDVKTLQLEFQNRKHPEILKEHDEILIVLADHLSVNFNDLKNLVQLFILSKVKIVSDSFLYFFKEEANKEFEIKRALDYSFAQIAILRKQVIFAERNLPQTVELPFDPNLALPDSLYKKIVFDNPKIDFTVGDLLDLVYLQISKSKKLTSAESEELLKACYSFGLFAKGQLSNTALKDLLQIKEDGVIHLLNILTDPDIKKRQQAMTKILDNDGPNERSIKIAVALRGLLTNCKFELPKKSKKKTLASNSEDDFEPIEQYLARELKYYPEVFDIFEIIFERDPSKFLQKSMPIFRRLVKSSDINEGLMESLFLLTLGEHFNPYNLANKLGILPDNITFFMHLIRIAQREDVREQELKEIESSIPVSIVLSKLKIKIQEFVNFARLIYGVFEDEDSMMEIISKLLISSNDKKNQKGTNNSSINLDLFRGIVILNKPMDTKLDIFKNKPALINLKKRLEPFFTSIDLTHHQENAFIISSLATGNFLVLRDYKQNLGWAFPTHDIAAENAIVNLTMALSGLLNPTVDVYSKLDKDIKTFVKEFYKGEPNFVEPPYKPGNAVLPNNTLAYAIYLAYQTLDITPKWIQAFLFDQDAFKEISEQIPNLQEPFIVAIVLNFISMPDIIRDILGLYDWTCSMIAFYKAKEKRAEAAEEGAPGDFKKTIDKINICLANRLCFNYQGLKDIANGVPGLMQKDHWANLFSNQKDFHAQINQALLHLYTEYNKKINKEVNFNDLINNPKHEDKRTGDPYKFILVLLGKDPEEKDEKEKTKTQPLVGEFMRNAIITAYNLVIQKFYEGKPPRYSGKNIKEKQVPDPSMSDKKNIKDQATKETQMPDLSILDLSMLGAISLLRLETDMTKKIYNLHQLTINIERKFFFDDIFYKMSKFKLMKIIGIPMNIQFSNLMEWYMSPSLFGETYITNMEIAKNFKNSQTVKDSTDKAKLSHCRELGYGRQYKIKKADGNTVAKTKKSKTVKRAALIGDLGVYPATFEEYISSLDNLLGHENWTNINLYLELGSVYVTNPEEVTNRKNKIQNNIIFDKCKPSGDPSAHEPKPENPSAYELKARDSSVYESKEIFQIVFDEKEAKKKFNIERIKYQVAHDRLAKIMETAKKIDPVQGKPDQAKPNLLELQEKDLDDIVDIKTGLQFKILRAKALDFEKTLMNPNTGLTLGIITGDSSQIENQNHVIKQKYKDNTKIYQAVIGLQSYRKRKNQYKKLKEYLDSLADRIDSDKSKLEELLNFMVSGRRNLSETISALEITEMSKDFLLISADTQIANDSKEQTKSILETIIHRVLRLPIQHIKAFEIIRNIYLFKKEGGWLNVVAGLSKSESDSGPLKNLIELIDFGKLKKVAKSGKSRKILSTLKSNFSDETNCMLEIFDKVVPSQNETPDLKVQHYVVQLLIQRDFTKIFDVLILGQSKSDTEEEEEEDKSGGKGRKNGESESKIKKNALENILDLLNKMQNKEDQTILDRVLKLLGIKTNQSEHRRGVNLLKLFLAVAHGNLISFRGRKNYKVVIDGILNEMIEANIFNVANDRKKELKKTFRRFSQLVLGALAWDFELCIKSFAEKETITEGYLLYHLYGCLNMNKLMLHSENITQAKGHLEAILYTILSRLTSKQFSATFSGEAKNFRSLLSSNPETNFEVLVQNLFETIHNSKEKKKPRPLSYYIAQGFKMKLRKELPTKPDFVAFVDLIWSICNGTIVVKLLDRFVSGSSGTKGKKNDQTDPNTSLLRGILMSLINLNLELVEFYNNKYKNKSNKNDKNPRGPRQADDENKKMLDPKLPVFDIVSKFLLQVKKLKRDQTKVWDNVMMLALGMKPDGQQIEPDSVQTNTLYLCLKFQKAREFEIGETKLDGFQRLKEVVRTIQNEPSQVDFILDMMAIILGINMKKFNLEQTKGTIKYDYNIEEKMDLFFAQVQSLYFGNREEKYGRNLRKIDNLVAKLKKDYANAIQDSKSKHLRKISEDILMLLQELDICSKEVINGVLGLRDGNLEEWGELVKYLFPEMKRHVVDIMVNSFNEAQNVFSAFNKPKNVLPLKGEGTKANFDSDEWANMVKKIKEGKANSKDLFNLVDEEGDKNGSINENEFRILANRLGLKLSSHRIKEIFAKVKGDKKDADQDLNEKEFEKALDYLQDKNLNQALQLLGITPEILTAILIRLTILLILIFVFIFLGIKAFAIGGTFGSIINSLFPAAGGLALGKENDQSDEKLDGDNVKDATDKGFEITTSEQL